MKKHLKDGRFVLQEASITTTLWLSFPLMQGIGIYKARPEELALAGYIKKYGIVLVEVCANIVTLAIAAIIEEYNPKETLESTNMLESARNVRSLSSSAAVTTFKILQGLQEQGSKRELQTVRSCVNKPLPQSQG